jgi:glycosyltransferase involved in cell wall biosynthesis
MRTKTWSPGSIVYYTGNRKNGLTPLNLKEGTSGTDSAVIYLAREWAKAGREVTVYSTCGDLEGNYDGVNYVNYYYFNPCDRFDTLIILSHPYLLPLPVKARQVCWDWHDVLGNEKVYPPEKIKRFDRIFAKSHYQRNLLSDLPDDRFTVVTNGIDESITLLDDQPKNPYKLIYSSRYYRGLDSMLLYGWPIIKAHVPEAELHIYHGWSRRELHTQHTAWREQLTSLFQQPGVFEHGRVSQEKLIQEKSTASIHYYACTYPEIDCISIRESAAVGCVPVTTDFAVFKEKEYCVRVPGEPTSQETQEAVAYQIISLLKNPVELENLRTQFKSVAQQETWQKISRVWLQAIDS